MDTFGRAVLLAAFVIFFGASGAMEAQQTHGITSLDYNNHHYPVFSGTFQSRRLQSGYLISLFKPDGYVIHVRLSGSNHGPFTTGTYYVPEHDDRWGWSTPCMHVQEIPGDYYWDGLESAGQFVVREVSYTDDDRIKTLDADPMAWREPHTRSRASSTTPHSDFTSMFPPGSRVR